MINQQVQTKETLSFLTSFCIFPFHDRLMLRPGQRSSWLVTEKPVNSTAYPNPQNHPVHCWDQCFFSLSPAAKVSQALGLSFPSCNIWLSLTGDKIRCKRIKLGSGETQGKQEWRVKSRIRFGSHGPCNREHPVGLPWKQDLSARGTWTPGQRAEHSLLFIQLQSNPFHS